jgi:hypothetical protein
MVKETIQAHIHFQHSAEEVAELKRAIIPMQEYIRAVGSQSERAKMRAVLGCEYFRARAASDMIGMLIRASKYAKLHLGDYFPLMRSGILDDALVLEEAVSNYKAAFAELKNVTLPTH